MIYPVLIGYDTGGEPTWEWKCDCETCLTTAGQCQHVMAANFDEDKKKPQDTAIYASLRRWDDIHEL